MAGCGEGDDDGGGGDDDDGDDDMKMVTMMDKWAKNGQAQHSQYLSGMENPHASENHYGDSGPEGW